MKRMSFIFLLILLMSVSSCDLFSTSSDKPDFKYSFKTAKDHYTADSTSSGTDKIEATFTNLSNQTLYLIYQTCLLIGLEKRSTPTEWKPISIPIFCAAVALGPAKINPGESEQVGIKLAWWTEPVEPLQSGVYRFTLAVKKPHQEKFLKVHSNPFEISY